jgi:hypothetical protein
MTQYYNFFEVIGIFPRRPFTIQSYYLVDPEKSLSGNQHGILTADEAQPE